MPLPLKTRGAWHVWLGFSFLFIYLSILASSSCVFFAGLSALAEVSQRLRILRVVGLIGPL